MSPWPEYLLAVIEDCLDQDINRLAEPTIGDLRIDEVYVLRYVNLRG